MRCVALVFAALALPLMHSAAHADGTSLNPLSALDRSSLDGFLARPLFAPGRRAPEPAAPPVVEAQAPEPPIAAIPVHSPPPRLRLTGVISGGSEPLAVVTNLQSNAIETLRLGDSLDGWLVTSIEPVRLRLTLDDRDEEFELFARDAAK